MTDRPLTTGEGNTAAESGLWSSDNPLAPRVITLRRERDEAVAECGRLREQLDGADDLLAEADAVIRELADDLKDRYIPDKGWPPHIEHANRLVAELAARALGATSG